jgi:hypothetical protein
MDRMIVNSRVGPDGVLRVTLPVGADAADEEVRVTVESLGSKQSASQAEYAAWVDSLAGTWEGEFECP